ncbi:unnamed protein product, partial [Heligmosomoides polygyrus]|uniref:DUF1758 domain-containing protein n=1 Tax=Heligmosomoides polygyrus TaxID=6339 RepID=A0A183FDJ0_HELPZ
MADSQSIRRQIGKLSKQITRQITTVHDTLADYEIKLDNVQLGNIPSDDLPLLRKDCTTARSNLLASYIKLEQLHKNYTIAHLAGQQRTSTFNNFIEKYGDYRTTLATAVPVLEKMDILFNAIDDELTKRHLPLPGPTPSPSDALSLESNTSKPLYQTNRRRQSINKRKNAILSSSGAAYPPKITTTRPEPPQSELAATLHVSQSTKTVKPPLMCTDVVLFNPTNTDKEVCVPVLLDTGASQSYITNDLATVLQLRTSSPQEITMFTFGNDEPISMQATNHKVGIRFINNATAILHVQALPILTTELKYSSFQETNDAQNQPVRKKIATPQLFIGMDYFCDLVFHDNFSISLLKNGYRVLETRIGKIVTDHSLRFNNSNITIVNYSSTLSSPARHTDLDKLVERFWTHESMGIIDEPNQSINEQCLDDFNSSIRYNPKERSKHKKIGFFNQIQLYDGTILLVPRLQITVKDYLTPNDFICVNSEGRRVDPTSPFQGTSLFCERHNCDEAAENFCMHDTPIALFDYSDAQESNKMIPIKAWGTTTREFYGHKSNGSSNAVSLSVMCSKGGITLQSNQEVDTIEACITSFCIFISQTSAKSLLFPTELIAFKYDVVIKVWQKGILVHQASTTCPPHPICEVLHCRLCLEHIYNTQCWRTLDIAFAISMFLLITTLCWILIPLIAIIKKLLNILLFPVKQLFKLLRRIRS